MCRKIGYDRNVRNRVKKAEFGWIVLNFIFYFGSITQIKVVPITFFWVIVPFIFDFWSNLLHLEFTLNFSTIFVGSFDIRASREVFPTEVRSPEIAGRPHGNGTMAWPPAGAKRSFWLELECPRTARRSNRALRQRHVGPGRIIWTFLNKDAEINKGQGWTDQFRKGDHRCYQ